MSVFGAEICMTVSKVVFFNQHALTEQHKLSAECDFESSQGVQEVESGPSNIQSSRIATGF